MSKDSEGTSGTGPLAYDKNKVLRVYRLVDAWPTSVGAINVAFDSNDAIEEFDVEFQYQYLDANTPGESVASGSTTVGYLSNPTSV